MLPSHLKNALSDENWDSLIVAMMKDKAALTTSKKRKAAEGGVVGEGGSKKVRLAFAPTAYVKLPHSPGGSLHGGSAEQAPNEKANIQYEADDMEVDEVIKSQDDPALPDPRQAKKKAGRRERRARAKEGYLKAKAEGTNEPMVSSIIKPQAQKRREARARDEHAEAERAARKAAKKEKKRVRAAMAKEKDQMKGEVDSSERVGKADEVCARRDAEIDGERLVARVDGRDGKNESGQPAWLLSAPLGGYFVDQDPIFVRDPESGEEFLITANQREVLLLSMETSLPARTCLVPDGSVIRCLSLNPQKEPAIWIACTNGHLYSWTWTLDNPAIRKSTFEPGVWTMIHSTEEKMFSVSKGRKSVLLNGTPLFNTKHQLQDLHVLGDAQYIVARGQYAIIIGSKNESLAKEQNGPTYTFMDIPLNEGTTCLDTRLTCVANSDRRESKRRQILSIAIGNKDGQILLYDDILSIFAQQGKPNLPSPRILHWHRQKVCAVKFSRDGNYLISGGEETVLVLWQLATGKKQFLPHLTSEIERIVVNPEGDKYALQMGDNSIMVLSTSELKPIANFAGLQLIRPTLQSAAKHAKAADSKRTVTAAVIHPQNTHQLLLSVPSTQPKSENEAALARPFLQTFDFCTSRHVARQALARNNVTDFNLGPGRIPIAPPDVGLLAISYDGQSLATVDEWMPPVSDVDYLSSNDAASIDTLRATRKEVFLKFWQWDEAQGLWTLSTRVAAPHVRSRGEKGARGAGTVFQLVAEPVGTSAAGFATVGEDGVVKLWKPKIRRRGVTALKTTSSNEGADEMLEWSCIRAVELPSYNAPTFERVDSPLFGATSALKSNMANAATSTSAPSICLAFSADGSILAAIQNPPESSENALPMLHFIDIRTGNISRTQSISEISAPLSTDKAQSFPVAVEALAFLDPFLIIAAFGVVLVYDLVADCALRRRFPIPIHEGYMTKLAVDCVEETFAVAVGAKVSVYDLKATDAKFVTRCGNGTEVAALLSSPSKRGYTLVLGDATVRQLTSTGLGRRLQLPPPPDVAPVVNLSASSPTEQQEQMSNSLALCTAAEEKEADERDEGPVESEDDRPVVRPEQLAEIFEGAPSFALPPVQEMYRAVAGLYGRKPLRLKGVVEDARVAVI